VCVYIIRAYGDCQKEVHQVRGAGGGGTTYKELPGAGTEGCGAQRAGALTRGRRGQVYTDVLPRIRETMLAAHCDVRVRDLGAWWADMEAQRSPAGARPSIARTLQGAPPAVDIFLTSRWSKARPHSQV